MMERITVRFDPEIDARGYDRMRSALDVKLTDGRTLTTEADTYPGGPERPLTRTELHAKFTDCATLVLPDGDIPPILHRLEHIETLPHLTDLLSPRESRGA